MQYIFCGGICYVLRGSCIYVPVYARASVGCTVVSLLCTVEDECSMQVCVCSCVFGVCGWRVCMAVVWDVVCSFMWCLSCL